MSSSQIATRVGEGAHAQLSQQFISSLPNLCQEGLILALMLCEQVKTKRRHRHVLPIAWEGRSARAGHEGGPAPTRRRGAERLENNS